MFNQLRETTASNINLSFLYMDYWVLEKCSVLEKINDLFCRIGNPLEDVFESLTRFLCVEFYTNKNNYNTS